MCASVATPAPEDYQPLAGREPAPMAIDESPSPYFFSPWPERLRHAAIILLAAGLAGWAFLIPAHAAPPTVTPSPGYDARLQEQRTASQAVQAPVAPAGYRKPV